MCIAVWSLVCLFLVSIFFFFHSALLLLFSSFFSFSCSFSYFFFLCDAMQCKPVQKKDLKGARNERSICAKNNKSEQGEGEKHLALVFFTSRQLAMQCGCGSDCWFEKKPHNSTAETWRRVFQHAAGIS